MSDIACVAAPRICPPGARAKMWIYFCASPKGVRRPGGPDVMKRQFGVRRRGWLFPSISQSLNSRLDSSHLSPAQSTAKPRTENPSQPGKDFRHTLHENAAPDEHRSVVVALILWVAALPIRITTR